MKAFNKELFKWLEEISDIYYNSILIPRVDIKRFSKDPDYARKKFLLYWAYERPNAPLAYKVAAIKTIESYSDNNSDYQEHYKQFYAEKKNPSRNPGYDKRILSIEFPNITKQIETGNLFTAYNMINLCGIGHKIKTFFIRDMVSLLYVENKIINNPEKLIFTQPVDVWIQYFMNPIKVKLELNCGFSAYSIGAEKKNLEIGLKILQLCNEANVSPVKVSQAMWFFCSRIVADPNRLEWLIKSQDISLFQKEYDLVGEYIVN